MPQRVPIRTDTTAPAVLIIAAATEACAACVRWGGSMPARVGPAAAVAVRGNAAAAGVGRLGVCSCSVRVAVLCGGRGFEAVGQHVQALLQAAEAHGSVGCRV